MAEIYHVNLIKPMEISLYGRFIPPLQDVVSSEDCASQSLPARVYRNIPSGESDESFPEEIRVRDPRHPLYGKVFRVLGRSRHGGGNFEPSYEVEYRNGVTLLVPVAAAEHQDLPSARTKLSVDALYDLLNAVECLHHHEHGTRTSLDDAAADPATTDRRRYRRGSGGGLP